jgi:hypothetical protein
MDSWSWGMIGFFSSGAKGTKSDVRCAASIPKDEVSTLNHKARFYDRKAWHLGIHFSQDPCTPFCLSTCVVAFYAIFLTRPNR